VFVWNAADRWRPMLGSAARALRSRKAQATDNCKLATSVRPSTQAVGARGGGKPQLSTRRWRGKTRGKSRCTAATGTSTTQPLPTTVRRTSAGLPSQLVTQVLSTSAFDSPGQPLVANSTTNKTADTKPVARPQVAALLRSLTALLPDSGPPDSVRSQIQNSGSNWHQPNNRAS
jgi:hypothetical protein